MLSDQYGSLASDYFLKCSGSRCLRSLQNTEAKIEFVVDHKQPPSHPLKNVVKFDSLLRNARRDTGSVCCRQSILHFFFS